MILGDFFLLQAVFMTERLPGNRGSERRSLMRIDIWGCLCKLAAKENNPNYQVLQAFGGSVNVSGTWVLKCSVTRKNQVGMF